MNDDRDHDRDRDHANDNGERPGSKLAPGPAAGGALTSLVALQTALANVNTTVILGRTGLPMMLFKSREDSGTWGFGQRRTIPETDSRWAINPLTFKYGAICFNGSKVVDERLVSVSQPKPMITEMPETGFPWQEEWAVNMKCTNGADAGVEVIFKATTDGALKAVALIVDQVRDRLNNDLLKDKNDPDKGKIVPIARLEKDSYPHPQHGKVWIPVLTIVDWMPLDGPVPASAEPKPPQSSPEQPRRRRVA